MKSSNGIKIAVYHTARFLKSLKRLGQFTQKKAEERNGIFKKDPFDSRLDTHKLHGRFQGFWAYSVDYHYRVVFVFKDSETVTYWDIGPHHMYGSE